jgi:hypothetical protein
MLKPAEGMEFEFDTSGPLRVEERTDGLYVVGGRILVAVGSREEGERIIAGNRAVRSLLNRAGKGPSGLRGGREARIVGNHDRTTLKKPLSRKGPLALN